jgi:predicted deacylase
MPADKLIDDELHRSTTAAALLIGKIPSFTVELGTGHMPDPAIVAASAAGTRNVMRLLGMLDDKAEEITGIKIVDPGSPHRRLSTPRVSEACVVLHRVAAGDVVQPGDIVADLVDIWGRPVGEGVLHSQYGGFVIGREHGIYYYPGDPVLSMAVPNDAPLVAPYPEDYFKIKA